MKDGPGRIFCVHSCSDKLNLIWANVIQFTQNSTLFVIQWSFPEHAADLSGSLLANDRQISAVRWIYTDISSQY